ncbi:MAG: aldo/keto reductase [Deltaproteobacteria bacterium]|nr:aldo/keto reductase [Deltaproteobacteria bacterium]
MTREQSTPVASTQPATETHEAGSTRRTERIRLGRTGPHVFPFALGCMGMSDFYGAADETESIATIHAALDRGVQVLDTGDFYGLGANELLIGKALRGRRRDDAVVSVKFGALRSPDGGFHGADGRPASVKSFLAYSLVRLGLDHVDVYRPARLDPTVPIEDTIGAIADMVRAGYVRAIGLSEVGPETIRRAHAVHPIVDLQIEYSLVSRGPERAIFPVLDELGIAVTAYGILSRGLLTGSGPTGPTDFRAHLPRFTGENRARNEAIVQALHRLASERDVSPAQLAIAWARAKGAHIVPLVGARTRRQLDESLAAMTLRLSPEEVARIEDAVPSSQVSGTRYPEPLMQHLDSER